MISLKTHHSRTHHSRIPRSRTPRSRILFAFAFLGATTLLVPSLPAESTKSAEAAGATLFRDKGCAYCHGATAQGTPKGPSLANIRNTKNPAQIADQIKNGGQKMPSFEDSLTNEEITQLIAYLRAKHRPTPAPAAQQEKPPA